MSLLDVNDLQVKFTTPEGIVTAVNKLSYKVNQGETLGIVGESGSGKSQSVFALMGLQAPNAIIQGSARFEQQELLNLPEQQLNQIRAKQISMIFQDPMTSLNPYMKVGEQLMEVLRLHKGLSKQQAYAESLAMLDAVKIPKAQQRMTMYPHEFSGGMCQRVMIAMALLCKPKLLIADEPSTALDVTVQAQIMQLLKELQKEFNTAVIMITHDLGVVAGICDNVLVMHNGEKQEYGSAENIFYRPQHPYTKSLLQAIPRLDKNQHTLSTVSDAATNTEQEPVVSAKKEKSTSDTQQAILDVQDIKVHFAITQKNAWPWSKPEILKAVDGISFQVYPGETLGIVGESGSGKSTLARAIIGLVKPTAGKVIWQGKDLSQLDKQAWQHERSNIQMIFQDPLGSLNPRMTVGDIVAEPLKTHFPELSKTERKQQVQAIMTKVGLSPNLINRYPHEFSGGQCQRIGIARALILKPKLIICDEPVSALDVSIQAQVINLLQELQQELGLSLIFIAHDLAVVKHISDRVLVMYKGNKMEMESADTLYDNPQHPYTQALLSAVPIPDPQIERNKTVQEYSE
ncbi:ABC transporter ATP-binding protein [Saccharobesus litoralis]|uniref:ABC transporter ATP-binding protein n=1 Tax=Saccharobesus litoralis TaxID=2172099 RepID=A0A2S0VQ75_9ALTE|nr:ABC transporter ATP-binding protein [Saccharobesus litoralis]AWB66349.1 ABC transporter ATP-binding protein [Saccharobesus litoralis]